MTVSETVRDALAIRRFERRHEDGQIHPLVALRAARGERPTNGVRFELHSDWRSIAGFGSWIPDPPLQLP